MSKESKHNHKATKCLKIAIFSMVMLAPFIAIGIKCLYVINNDNAKESYRGSYTFESTQNLNVVTPYSTLTNYGSMQNGSNMFKLGDFTLTEYHYYCDIANYYLSIAFNVSSFTDLGSTYYNYQGDLSQLKSIYIRRDGNSASNIYLMKINAEDIDYNSFYASHSNDYIYTFKGSRSDNDTITTNFIFNLSSNFMIGFYWNQQLQYERWANDFTIDTFVYDNTLSSVFYSSVQELDNASIFKWTTNTGTYTAVNNMCTTLGIVSPPLAVLITYWTLISVIYIIIDIVLETLIYLTHWINDKMI